ncbi:DUF4277 domain-containing protein [Streptomyces buecherae]|uniref:DUF4277 domain-containing protein n=1 Tax=Streptomyces buecherae TaxID=2763006 RepID=A0A7H8N1E9_9ACTN|nr:DUF4277 domain-containing protein [Streptomyces buecherae]QKW54108.1 DUF4277 domain-containing protein [Streptomyces buecherae]
MPGADRDPHIAHRQVIKALIASRLSSLTPMSRINRWARHRTVDEVFGITCVYLNDDRTGRALDAIRPAPGPDHRRHRRQGDHRVRHRDHPLARGHHQPPGTALS